MQINTSHRISYPRSLKNKNAETTHFVSEKERREKERGNKIAKGSNDTRQQLEKIRNETPPIINPKKLKSGEARNYATFSS